MRRYIKHIFILASVLAGLSSCSKGDMNILETAGKVVMTGIISDKDTAEPLQDITITLNAYSQSGRLLQSVISYSSNNGIYTIEAEGFYTALSCTLTASDQDGRYLPNEIQIDVPWSGPSFNSSNGTFVVNDCNFHLQKKR